MRGPKLFNRFAHPIWSPIAAYVAAPILVGLVAFLIRELDIYIQQIEHLSRGGYSNPNLIAFLLPIVLVSVLGGRGPGRIAIVLAGIGSLWLLPMASKVTPLEDVSFGVNLAFMLFIGYLLCAGLDYIRDAARAQAEVTEELARHTDRVQRIATAFQDPLVPKVSGMVGGLDVAHYYRPAFDEARVGGDFIDAFETQRGDAVIVLGDISGKGLTAATQVSTVKSIVRYALHRKTPRDLADVLTQINDALAAQDLLTGFATLFVGIYDAGEGRLTYVSCGHEPALLRRGPSDIEELPPTGPIIGPFPAMEYRLAHRTLGAGDTFVVYTDGLSDSGPSRDRMLGGAGLARLLADGSVDGETPQQVVDRIIEGTRAHAEGQISDDACVLVCTVARAPGAVTEGVSSGERRELRLPLPR